MKMTKTTLDLEDKKWVCDMLVLLYLDSDLSQKLKYKLLCLLSKEEKAKVD